jgi:predicted branched-subunit amino acid permease
VQALIRHPEFRTGIRDMASVAPGIGAWGLMTGVAMVQSGLSLVEVLLMTVLVFAGSSQLAAIPLIAAGAPMWVILATSFCVNLRFVVFSAHLRPYVMHQTLGRRLLSAYPMADLNYVMFTQRFPQPATDAAGIAAQDAYWAGHCATAWTSWTLTGLAGVAMANAIPLSWGLGFAGVLALLGIGCSLVTTRLRAVSAGIAGLVAVATFALPLKLNILVAIGASVALCLMLERAAGARTAEAGGGR